MKKSGLVPHCKSCMRYFNSERIWRENPDGFLRQTNILRLRFSAVILPKIVLQTRNVNRFLGFRNEVQQSSLTFDLFLVLDDSISKNSKYFLSSSA